MRKWIKYGLILAIILGLTIAYLLYSAIYRPNVPSELENTKIEIPKGSGYEDVVNKLVKENLIEDESSFRLVSKLMKFDQKNEISGRYLITPGSNNRELISMLRAGRQIPVNVTISQVRLLSEMVGKIARYIELDSLQIYDHLTNEDHLSEWGYTRDDIMTLFIPNTYEMYWDTSLDQLVSRMQSEHDKYWSQQGRKEAITSHNLDTREAYILASIIEKETNNKSEVKTIAGVYHNRLKRGMPLEADPTVVFAIGDFSIRRVLNKHLKTESPYNTYLNPNLPPGPICMPSLSSLDAAIFPEDHEYIFFCARPGYDNEHAFASTLRQHNRNARIFHQWLNKQGIRR